MDDTSLQLNPLYFNKEKSITRFKKGNYQIERSINSVIDKAKGNLGNGEARIYSGLSKASRWSGNSNALQFGGTNKLVENCEMADKLSGLEEKTQNGVIVNDKRPISSIAVPVECIFPI